MAEEEHKEEHKEEKKEGEKSGGIGASFQKHKTLWIVGGVGAAGVLLLLFMNSGGSQQQQAAPNTQDLSTVGQGGAVDTSSLVGSGGAPSWYNAGAAENLDYWPYVPNQGDKSGSSGGGGTKSSGGGTKSSGGGTKSSGGGTKSSGGGTKSSGGGTKSSGGSKSGGGVTHGTSHGAGGKTTKPSTKGTAHGHIITVNKATNIAALQTKYFPGSNGSNQQGNIKQYGNNAKLLKGHISKTGVVKAGTRLVV